MYYDETGTVVGTGNFEQGSGTQKAWWPNGEVKRIAPYQKNLKHGEEQWFDEDGKLQRTIIYDQGVEIQ